MAKRRVHFEVVPVEEVVKILEKHDSTFRSNGNRKILVRKKAKASIARRTQLEKPEVSAA